MKGTLAFDIDGTITHHPTMLPDLIVDQLTRWAKNWHIVLITGRPFSYAKKPLQTLTFPYILGVQNGADVISMPEERRVAKHYVGRAIIDMLEKIYQNEKESFFIYRGFEAQDYCYYRPHCHSKEMLEYVRKVTSKTGLPWTAIDELSEISEESFPLIKCVGPKKTLHRIAKQIADMPDLNIAQVADPIFPQYDLLLINDRQANKGKALQHLIEQKRCRRPLIVAGDDNNDIPMMKEADFAVGMNGGSPSIEPYVTIKVDFDEGRGLIKGIEEGIKYVSSK
tara:strand:+ start:437 stop:1279 length:843 start_codon:yes stop_codon:yes gene_type:complete